MSAQSARADERNRYGPPQHTPTAGWSPQEQYGDPQHETNVEDHFSAAEIDAAGPRDTSGADRTSRPDTGRARARPAGD
ncbi:hypothetical protein [Halostella salina]|uniref:hypothetical protein n=1 Tax=Halostella salina TaxID=1547897 RepID=UPI000EF7EA62|nr:hypothetical protein [Halostella salina]